MDLEKCLFNSISGEDVADYFQQLLDDLSARSMLVSPSVIVADHLESLVEFGKYAFTSNGI